MLTDAEIDRLAQECVASTFPKDCEILHREPYSNPDGIYFVANRRSINDSYVGSGGFFVVRASGEIWQFGSGQIVHEGLQYWLNWYSAGWRLGLYRVVFRSVRQPRVLAELIVQAGATYLFREVSQGVVWERQLPYDAALVVKRLDTLPCTFLLGADQIQSILGALGSPPLATVEYEQLVPGSRRDWHPDRNLPEQLGPQYEEAP